MTPTWLNEIVVGFGRQLGLERFELNDHGVAGLRVENGLSVRLEYAQESLLMMVGVAVPPSAATMTRLLALVHPDARRQPPMRACYLARTGEAVYAVRVPEREVTVTQLEAVFRSLWTVAEQFRRAVQ